MKTTLVVFLSYFKTLKYLLYMHQDLQKNLYLYSYLLMSLHTCMVCIVSSINRLKIYLFVLMGFYS